MTPTVADAITERDFQKQVEDALDLFGWKWAHFKTSIGYKGFYQTAMSGHKGWPDIVATRAGRLVTAELKSEAGVTDKGQRGWLYALAQAGCEVYVWKPSDIDDLIQVLR